MKRLLAIAIACGLALGPAAGGAQARDFTTKIDNRYMPFRVGSSWVYREAATDGTVQRVVVKVTNQTKRIANGATARVVRDTVTEKGKLVEDTFDWYAQDKRGNVWYLGEDTKEYKNGKVVSTEGSWEAGVDGARGGIVMPARPRAGRQYRQEYYPGHAEDEARILSLDDQAQVPAGHYQPTLLTKEWNPLEPSALEYKVYARGVGLVLELGVSGDLDRAELLRFKR
jgi:hypothetical protein